MPRVIVLALMFLGIACVFPKNAHANIGLPMIFLGVPFMVMALIPVVIIEALVYRKQLVIPFKKALAGSAGANILTTIIGYPLAWVLHMFLGWGLMWLAGLLLRNPIPEPPAFVQYLFFPLMSAWLYPGTLTWQIYLAGVFGLVPAFFVSVWIEGLLLKRIFKEHHAIEVKNSVWKANKITYSLLAIFVVVLTVFQLLLHLNVFTPFRDRADEKTAFQTFPAGALVAVSSEGIASLDPSVMPAKIRLERFEQDARGRDSVAITPSGVWSIVPLRDEKKTGLYFYDFASKKAHKTADFIHANELKSFGDHAVVVGRRDEPSDPKDRYRDAGLYAVSSRGEVRELYTGNDSRERFPAMVFAPAQDKIIYVKFIDSEPLMQGVEDIYLIHDEIRLYDFASGEDRKLADFQDVSRSRADTYNIGSPSWHPDATAVYFSTIDPDRVQQFRSSADLAALKRQYRLEGRSNNYGDLMDFEKDIRVQLNLKVMEVSLDGDEVRPVGIGKRVFAWSPDRSKILLAGIGDEDTCILVDRTVGIAQPVSFAHADRGGVDHVAFSPDGKFLAYLGGSTHFLDRHFYNDSYSWRGGNPHWVWIKEISSGRERKLGVEPVLSADAMEWRN